MTKRFTKTELISMGMTDSQINAILAVYDEEDKMVSESSEIPEDESLSISSGNNMIQMQHKVDMEVKGSASLVPTSITDIASYKVGTIVELPPFGDGQPLVVRMTRPSMLALVKSGKIPNSLLNQATSLFANGTGALNGTGKNSTNINQLFEVIDVIVDAALLEPKLSDIRSVGMELTDDQLMAIFSYTQRGVKALEQFRTE